MSNGEICRWAWDKSREYRGVIWAVALLTFLVELPQITLGLLELLKGWNLPFGWEIPFQWVGTMAGFGLTGVILGLALEQETSPGKVFLPFSRDYFKRAALLALFLTVVTALIRIVPNRIIFQGQEGMKAALTQIEMTEDEGAWNSLFGEYMKASDRVSKGEMINNIISIVLEVVFFPLPYLLFLSQEEKTIKLLQENMWNLSYNLFWILGIQVRTIGPFILVVLFAVFFLNNTFIAVALVGIGFFLWYPWATLALARSAAEVLGKGPRDPWWART